MYGHDPRRLSRYSPGGPLPGGKVEVAIMPSGDRRVVAGAVWASWAGEPVEDVGRRARERWPEAETAGRVIVGEEEPPA